MNATRTCSIDDCPREHRARGWCVIHYNRWKRTGDVGEAALIGPEERRNWSGDRVTYRGAHLRVQHRRGPATTHPCISCGSTADHWAYRGGDPAELRDGRGLAYSGDPTRYDPRCAPCHSAFDGGRIG